MIKVFCGCDGNNSDLESQMVYEASLRRYASEPVTITWMRQSKKGPHSGWNMRGRTPFTAFRWSPPAVCNFEGRAIVTDVDFIWRADVAELWHQPIPAVVLMKDCTGKLTTSSMVIDCAKAKGHFPTLDELRRMADAHETVTHYFRAHKDLVSPFDGLWNCIDGGGVKDVHDPIVKALHYSRIETQPALRFAVTRLKKEGGRHWYSGEVREHWRPDVIALFNEEYDAALAAGYSIEDYRVTNGVQAQRRPFAYKHHKGDAVAVS